MLKIKIELLLLCLHDILLVATNHDHTNNFRYRSYGSASVSQNVHIVGLIIGQKLKGLILNNQIKTYYMNAQSDITSTLF